MNFHNYKILIKFTMTKIKINLINKLSILKKINLNISASARNFLAERGYDPVYGARPLRRVIQRELQNKLATEMLKGTIKDGDLVNVEANDDGIELKKMAKN